MNLFLAVNPGVIITLVVIAVLVLIVLFSGIVIVHQTEAYVVERIGKYRGTLDVGFHIILPFFDKVVKKVSLKEHVVDFKPQPVITKDNVTMQIDTVATRPSLTPVVKIKHLCFIGHSEFPCSC